MSNLDSAPKFSARTDRSRLVPRYGNGGNHPASALIETEQAMRIKLTARQVELLRPYFDRVRAAAVMGSPGMLVGQISRDDDGEYAIVPAFLDHDLAKQITQRGRDLPKLERLKGV